MDAHEKEARVVLRKAYAIDVHDLIEVRFPEFLNLIGFFSFQLFSAFHFLPET
jgi:hypothetical protein